MYCRKYSTTGEVCILANQITGLLVGPAGGTINPPVHHLQASSPSVPPSLKVWKHQPPPPHQSRADLTAPRPPQPRVGVHDPRSRPSPSPLVHQSGDGKVSRRQRQLLLQLPRGRQRPGGAAAAGLPHAPHESVGGQWESDGQTNADGQLGVVDACRHMAGENTGRALLMQNWCVWIDVFCYFYSVLFFFFGFFFQKVWAKICLKILNPSKSSHPIFQKNLTEHITWRPFLT